MRKSYALLCALFLLIVQQSGQAQCTQTVWEDNFDGTGLNTAVWAYDLGDGSGSAAGAGWGNAELQSYTNSADNIKVENGNLVITAKYSGGAYTAAKIKTTASVGGFFKFGRVEARMKLPSAKGVWPAFWMLPKTGSWPNAGEIDIMEASHKNPSKTQSTVHYGYPAGAHQYTGGSLATADLSADFHVYAMEWGENVMRFYFDDELYLTLTPDVLVGKAWPFNEEFYIMFNVAVGGPNTPYTGNVEPNSGDYPTSLEVDYVRVQNGAWSTSILGEGKVYQNDVKNYSVPDFDGATYAWEVPVGATLKSGQGTSAVVIEFMDQLEGELSCTITSTCGTNVVKKAVVAEAPFSVKKIYEDFETNRNVTYGNVTGTLDQVVDNPDAGAPNTSTKVGKYVRNASEDYDVIALTNVTVDEAGLYVNQQRRIHLDVYSSAPVGTKVRFQFENSSVSTPINYPYGRHSVYDAYTTKQNAWETLEFVYDSSPDINILSSEIDLFTVLIDPATKSNHTIWFDNLVFGQPGADPVYTVSSVFEDFDGNSLMEKSIATGDYSVVANPTSNDVNNSANCLKYTRNAGETYDVVTYHKVKGITDASQYKTGNSVFYMDVLTDAPVGTPFVIQLENSGMSTSENYPLGRNSKYLAATTKQNEWETIQFSFASTIDVGTGDVSVDQIVLLIDAGKNTGSTFYIDNIRAGSSNAAPISWVQDQVYEDFDGTSLLTYTSSNGIYDGVVSNPASGGLNTSAHVGKYTRNGSEAYDALFFDNVSIGDAALFRKGEKRFALDLYTDLPAGTLVNVQLEDRNLSTPSNYPSGRHSYYQGVVKESNTWHTIDFLYTASPDAAVSNANVNTSTFLFAPNSDFSNVVYFDNFRSYKKEANANAAQLSVSTSTLATAYTANSSSSFDITSKNTAWTVTSDQGWATTSSSTGVDNSMSATITVAVTENTIAKPRTATLTVSATGVSSKKVTLTQAAAPDTERPTDFTAVKGAENLYSIELVLQATDNSGFVTYTITYGDKTQTVQSESGVSKTVTLNDLPPATAYSFSVAVADATGNVIATPIVVDASTIADTEAPTGFVASIGSITSNSVELVLSATDNSGKINYTITNGANAFTTEGQSGEETRYKITGLNGSTEYTFSIAATDSENNAAANNPLTLKATTYAGALGNECFGNANESAEGDQFLAGYKFVFETQGTNVKVTFELLDASKIGLVAFLFNRTNGFAETQMDNPEGFTFTTTLNGQTTGSVLTLACKFAYAGGLAVTRDFTYTVGNTCESTPTVALSAAAVTLLADATTNKTFDIQSNTDWTIASDQAWLTVNQATGSNNATINLQAQANPNTTPRTATLTVTSGALPAQTITITQVGAVITTECAGAGVQSQDGQAFVLGYTYQFETIGNDVKVTFDLIDKKDGLVAFLFNKTNGFSEVQMQPIDGQTFTATLTGQTTGTTITVACKYAYANGLSVTKDVTYVVGTTCEDKPDPITSIHNAQQNGLTIYPNPVQTRFTLGNITAQALISIYTIGGQLLFTQTAQSANESIDVSQLNKGVYLIKVQTNQAVQTARFQKQ